MLEQRVEEVQDSRPSGRLTPFIPQAEEALIREGRNRPENPLSLAIINLLVLLAFVCMQVQYLVQFLRPYEALGQYPSGVDTLNMASGVANLTLMGAWVCGLVYRSRLAFRTLIIRTLFGVLPVAPFILIGQASRPVGTQEAIAVWRSQGEPMVRVAKHMLDLKEGRPSTIPEELRVQRLELGLPDVRRIRSIGYTTQIPVRKGAYIDSSTPVPFHYIYVPEMDFRELNPHAIGLGKDWYLEQWRSDEERTNAFANWTKMVDRN